MSRPPARGSFRSFYTTLMRRGASASLKLSDLSSLAVPFQTAIARPSVFSDNRIGYKNKILIGTNSLIQITQVGLGQFLTRVPSPDS